MATKSTTYTTCSPICCGNTSPANVFICIPSELVITTSVPTSFIPATISTCCNGTNAWSTCGTKYYNYIISYDDTLLVADTVLMGDQITGVICDNCLTDYIQNKLELLTGPMVDGVAATGTTQGTGYNIESTVNRFTTVTTGVADACVLPNLESPAWGFPYVVVVNAGAGILQVFPSSGEFINSALVDVAVTIASGSSKVFYKCINTNYRWVSVG